MKRRETLQMDDYGQEDCQYRKEVNDETETDQDS